MSKYILLLITVMLPFSLLSGQGSQVSPKAASVLFNEGRYQEAKVLYKSLLEKYSRNPQYNYYYGVTLALTKDDYSEAIRRLRFAEMNGISKDVYFYLGRALQCTYEFTEAKKNFLQFKRVASLGDNRVETATKYIQECDFGIQNSSKYYAITVVDKDTVNRNKILSLYYPSKDVGNILKNSDFFQSGVDPNGIMYISERKDEAYFSLYSVGSAGQDLYKMVKLLDGWSDNDALPATINTPYDEVYPFVASNGSTLYFASNKPGGYGGYDIYKTELNIATKTYSDPINMGIPFNSPYDDFLFVSDNTNSIAWFASDRETMGDVVMVYKLNWDNNITKSIIVESPDILKASKLEVSIEALKDAQRKGNYTYQSTQAKARTAPFKFLINDTLSYTTFDQFKSPDALEYFRRGYNISLKRDSLNSKMREKRSIFQMSADEAVKDKMVLDILKMEKELYGYDDIIEESNFVARRLEIEKIREMLGTGNFTIDKIKPSNTYNLTDDIELTPDKYLFYSAEAFEKRARSYSKMYENVFDDMDIVKLAEADSIYVWGSILTLESSDLSDKAAHSNQASKLKYKKELSKDEDTAGSTELLMAESKKLKEVSLRFLLTALDEKFAIYSLKLGEIIPRINAEKGQYFSNESARANAYYREGSGMYSSDDALELSQVEKVISYKKMAVDTQDKILFDYSNSSKQGWTLAPSPSSSISPKTASATVKPKNSTATNQAIVKATANGSVAPKPKEELSESVLIYKIQIGVFRNTPSEDLLYAIPQVTSEQVEGKDLVKYYAGKYTTAEEAVANIQSVKDAGFPNAYLVAFYNGVQIDLGKAKSLEGK